MKLEKLELSRAMIRLLTKKCMKLEVVEFMRRHPSRGTFIISELPGLGPDWAEQYLPFRDFYETGKVAGQEAGKLLGVVAKELGLQSKKEGRHGKADAITRYSF